MNITHLAYLGPASHKTVQGVEFPKDVPVPVVERQARAILRYWPSSFVGLTDCPNCKMPEVTVIAEPEPIVEESVVNIIEPEVPDFLKISDTIDQASDGVEIPVKKRQGRPRKE